MESTDNNMQNIDHNQMSQHHIDVMNIFKIFKSSIANYVKEKYIKPLSRMKIDNVRDLLFHKPNHYIIKKYNPRYYDIKHNDYVIIDIVVIKHEYVKKNILSINVQYENKIIKLIFFRKPHNFILCALKPGSKAVIDGKIDLSYSMQIHHPDLVYDKKSSSTLNYYVEPVYPLTYGITNKQIHSQILEILSVISKSVHVATSVQTNVDINSDLNIINLFMLLKKMHKPSYQDLEKQNHASKSEIQPIVSSSSIKRILDMLSMLEIKAFQYSMQQLRKKNNVKYRKIFPNKTIQNSIIEQLKFTLTTDQAKSLQEIEDDQQNRKMMRLLQGDVGVGKTLVALLSAVNTIGSCQTALMTPTDILTNQHYYFFNKYLLPLNVKVAMLTGSTKSTEKKKILENLKTNKIDIIIGTHALFQDNVEFYDLGYIIIDEQHKFGVLQRFSLINKAQNPDTLIMTATPIPRSLKLAIFGDMDSSQIKSKINNRKTIITSVIPKTKVDTVVLKIQNILQRNEKVYWVCPLIEKPEEDEKNNINVHIQDATTRYLQLNHVFKNKVGLLTGKTNSQEKEVIMQRFQKTDMTEEQTSSEKVFQNSANNSLQEANDIQHLNQQDSETAIDILVATTVIEVGIDVKNATLIVIDDAQQFGLSQIHQLRGRVGRSDKQSYCVLLYNEKRISNIGRQRLQIIKNHSDGFEIAEQDLVLRGGGEVLGIKQSGTEEFFFFNQETDVKLMSKLEALKDINKELSVDTKIMMSVFSKVLKTQK